jgi:hypothetical protein
LVSRLSGGLTARQRADAVDGYLAIVDLLDSAAEPQIELDRKAFEAASGVTLTLAQLAELRTAQRSSRRRVFLLAGMTHPRFVESLREVSTAGAARVHARASGFA